MHCKLKPLQLYKLANKVYAKFMMELTTGVVKKSKKKKKDNEENKMLQVESEEYCMYCNNPVAQA